jgi:hypothetical protein
MKARDPQGSLRYPDLCGVSRGVVTVSAAEKAMHEGRHYFLKTWFDVTGKGTTIDFLFRTPALPWRIHGNGRLLPQKTEFTFGFYEDVVVSDPGTLVPSINNDLFSNRESLMPVWATPTITDLGKDIWPAKVGISGQAVSLAFNYEYFPKPDTYYLTRITKDTMGTHWIDIDFWWYETLHKDPTIT